MRQESHFTSAVAKSTTRVSTSWKPSAVASRMPISCSRSTCESSTDIKLSMVKSMGWQRLCLIPNFDHRQKGFRDDYSHSFNNCCIEGTLRVVAEFDSATAPTAKAIDEENPTVLT